jgi:hypothetical protein
MRVTKVMNLLVGRTIVSLLAAGLLLLSIACGPPSGDWSGTTPDPPPELTEEAIKDRINDTRVFDVPPADGNGEPISWGFDEDEPKEITIVERVDEGDRIIVTMDVTTRSAPRAREPKELSGRIKTFFEIETGWALRRWEIKRTENISMTYKRLPKPAGQNTPGDVDDMQHPPPLPPPANGAAPQASPSASPSPRR